MNAFPQNTPVVDEEDIRNIIHVETPKQLISTSHIKKNILYQHF